MENMLPKWLVNGLGGLLIALVALLVIDRAHQLNDLFANKNPQNTMTVSAEGKVTATPDLATVTIGVISQGSDAASVKDQNNKKVNAIIDYIKQQGVDQKDINTSQFYFYPRQNYDNGKSTITGYEGNQTVTVKVHGIDKDQQKLETILDGVIGKGANQIQGVSLTFEDPDNLKQEARKQAIEKAKQKAQELAREAGITLGKVISVSESGSTGYPGPIPYVSKATGMGGAAMDSVAPNIEPGSQDITETMSVVFEVK